MTSCGRWTQTLSSVLLQSSALTTTGQPIRGDEQRRLHELILSETWGTEDVGAPAGAGRRATHWAQLQ